MNSFRFLFDLPSYQAERMPQKVCGALWRQGIRDEISSVQLQALTQRWATALLREGINKGDRIILLADKYNMHWLAADMAIMACGAISVPLHFPLRSGELVKVTDRLEPTLILHTLIAEWDPGPVKIRSISLEELNEISSPIIDADIHKLTAIRDSLSTDDIATIVHTSGSSGEPRAVCLSHGNVVSNVLSVLSVVPFSPDTRVMSFLPLSHIFERIVCYVYLACGANIYFLDTYRNALWALKDVKPEYFTSVPLVLERFVAALENRIEETSSFTRWAYRSWEKNEPWIIVPYRQFYSASMDYQAMEKIYGWKIERYRLRCRLSGSQSRATL